MAARVTEIVDRAGDALRAAVNPACRFHHSHEESRLDLADMPDTTGEEVPAEAMKYATFLKLEKPKRKSHPSRGNIHV